MNIIEHGAWSPYEPTEDDPDRFKDHGGILYARRDGDRRGWYRYIRDEKSFKANSLKATVYPHGDQHRVGAVTKDVSRLFPSMPGTLLIEIENYPSSDPQKDLGGKLYDPHSKTFSDYEHPAQSDPIEALKAELAELRAFVSNLTSKEAPK